MIVRVEVAKDVNVGLGASWKDLDGLKSRAMSLGRYTTETDASISAIGMAFRELPSILSKTSHQNAEVVLKSKIALAEIRASPRWQLSSITDVERSTQSE